VPDLFVPFTTNADTCILLSYHALDIFLVEARNLLVNPIAAEF